jgi:hypothetical protein
MTDIAFQKSIQNLPPQNGQYMTGHSRNIVSKYNTSTHFIFGKHSTIHYSEAKLKTALRPGLANGQQRKSGSALGTCGSNFQIGTG